jgi:hypothetical protein
MKTIRRTAWPWLLLAVICWCGNGCQKTLEVHYVQIEACQTWNDTDDNPDNASPTPLVVFRLVNIKNTSARGTPDITFDLQHVFFDNDGVQEHPDNTSIPNFHDLGQTTGPGQSVHFPQGRIRALFAIQVFFGRTEDVRGLEFLLQYDPRVPPVGGSSTDEKVFMVRDPFPSTFQPFCGRTALSAIQ